MNQKAGREGFRQNAAYSDFTRVLRNFFVQLAIYFREGEPEAASYVEQKDRIEAIFNAKKERERQRNELRRQLEKKLNSLHNAVLEGEPQRLVRALLDEVRSKLARVRASESARAQISSIEATALQTIQGLRARFELDVRSDLGLPRDLRLAVDEYQQEISQVERQILSPAVGEITQLVEERGREIGSHANQRRRLSGTARSIASRVEDTIASRAADARAACDRVLAQLDSATSDLTNQVKRELKALEDESARAEVRPATLSKRFAAFDQRMDALEKNARTTLGELATQLRALQLASRENEISSATLSAALEEELLELRSRSEEDLQLAQLGMAVQIVNHEFASSISSVRSGLRELRTWSRANPELAPVHKRIENSFQHLESYLGLFTPLQRRTRRSATQIAGTQVFRFIDDLFVERLRENKISISATRAFKSHHFAGYPSTFYPVFVNLVDNASFWLRRQREKRVIVLDADKDGMYVSNSGPSILGRERERIFDYGYTHKPGGQGLGLFISRQVLRKEGYDLRLVTRPGFSVTFAIVPME